MARSVTSTSASSTPSPSSVEGVPRVTPMTWWSRPAASALTRRPSRPSRPADRLRRHRRWPGQVRVPPGCPTRWHVLFSISSALLTPPDVWIAGPTTRPNRPDRSDLSAASGSSILGPPIVANSPDDEGLGDVAGLDGGDDVVDDMAGACSPCPFRRRCLRGRDGAGALLVEGSHIWPRSCCGRPSPRGSTSTTSSNRSARCSTPPASRPGAVFPELCVLEREALGVSCP